MKAKQHEFLALVQGNQSVAEYLQKFNHLARYSLYDVATEERKMDIFLGGLNPQLRCALSMFDFTDFQTLVDKAFIAEREHKLIADNRPVNNDNKRKLSQRRMGNQCKRLVPGSRLRWNTGQIGNRMLTRPPLKSRMS